MGRPDALLLEICEERIQQLQLQPAGAEKVRAHVERGIVVDRIRVERQDGCLVDVPGPLSITYIGSRLA